MAFEFVCPQCGASSRAEEFMIGESGPCHVCGEVVTVFPLSSHTEPPQVMMAAPLGALTNGAAFFTLLFGLRSIPLISNLRTAAMLTPKNVLWELGATALAGLVGLALGAVYFGLAALVVDTRRAYRVIRRGLFIGALIGFAVGAIIGISIMMGRASGTFIAFYERGDIIATAAVCGLAAVQAVGGLLAIPFAMHGQKRLVSQAKFTAPTLVTDPAAPIEAKLIDEPVEVSREQLTSDRRQALIRRLGVVHEPDDEPEETEETEEPDQRGDPSGKPPRFPS